MYDENLSLVQAVSPRSRLHLENLFQIEGSLAYPSYPVRANFSYISLKKTLGTIYISNKKLAQLEG